MDKMNKKSEYILYDEENPLVKVVLYGDVKNVKIQLSTKTEDKQAHRCCYDWVWAIDED